MDSKEEPNEEGHRHNAATENSDTMALHKKRARRVSFAAEMTSVHFFDRDDEEYNETPLLRTAKVDDSAVESGSGGHSERNKESEGEDDNNDEDDEEMEIQRTFLRPIGSPSPGGSTFGSASSNDEENFFGPVSANFIRPGRLSDSAASDDNHDVTMDSTAFSMHFRSLASSESGLDLKTPTGGKLFLEEETPTESNTGSHMVVTLGKKLIRKSAVLTREVSGSHSSNDMSLVGANPIKYDYDKLSPGLDAILAEGRINLLSVSVSDDIVSVSPKKKAGKVLSLEDFGDNLVNLGDSERERTGWINNTRVLNGDKSAAQNEFGEMNSPHGIFLSCPSPNRFSTCTLGAAASRDNHRPNNSSYQLSKEDSEMSLVPSTSSPVKPQEVLLTSASPSKPLGLVSPFTEQSGSLVKNGRLEHQETETSIQRSISKLELLEKSTLSSTFSTKFDKSTVKSLDFSKSPYFDYILEKNHHMSRIGFAEDSVTGEKAASVLRSTEGKFSFSMDHARGENHLKGPMGQIISGKSPNELSSKNIFADQLKSGAHAASPSKITWPGDNLVRGLFTSTHDNEDSIMIETESLLAEIAPGEGGKANTPEFVCSPGRLWVKKLSASPGFRSSKSNDLLLQSQIKQIQDFDSGQDSTSVRNVAHSTPSSATANMSVALSKGMNRELNPPSIEVNLFNLIELKTTNNRKVDIKKTKEIVGATGNFSTLAKENKSQIVHSENLVLGNMTSSGISSFNVNIPGAESRTVSHDSDSPPANKDQPRFQKSLVQFPAGSSSRKEPDSELSFGVPYPEKVQLSGGLDNFSAKKRNLELLLRDTQYKTDITIMGKGPKLLKGGNYDPEIIVYPVVGRTNLTGHEKKMWKNVCLIQIYSKFTEDLKALIFGSADEHNSSMIDVLEDKLLRQQRSKVYEFIHLGVMLQNKFVHHDLKLEKITEANSLLHRVVFEKAKLQLKHVKREKLLNRLELLSAMMQETQNLGSSIVSLPLETCTSNVQVDAVGDRSLSLNLKKEHERCMNMFLTRMAVPVVAKMHDTVFCEKIIQKLTSGSRWQTPRVPNWLLVFREKLTTSTQALEALDRKILNLTRTFHACCKMKVEPGSGDTIALVNEYLMKRASCRLTRLDMQMWVVHSVGSVNGQHNVVLNYLDFIRQSTKIIIGSTSTARTSFKLNETNITKNFPSMNTCIAFSFLFDGETVCKYIGAKTLVHETQVTNSLLGTLLDVIVEVQLAQLEFQNLTHSSFCSSSAERLDLKLCFFNFNYGRKVILTLDMSCLKRGIYPSEVLPLEAASTPDSKQCSVYDEIRNAVNGVRRGYMRILRLCRCVSLLLQGSTA